MNSRTCFFAAGLAVCSNAASAVDPQKGAKPDTGQSKWSQSYSHSWGDALPSGWPSPSWRPPGSSAGRPAWQGAPWSSAPWGGSSLPPMPALPNAGEIPRWDLPFNRPRNGESAGRAGFQSSNTVSFTDTPIMMALVTLQGVSDQEIVVTRKAVRMLKRAERAITFSHTNLSPEELVAKVLGETGCEVTTIGDRIVIHAEGEKVAEDQLASVTAPIIQVQLESALELPITLTMRQTPLPFVAQMLEGMTRVRIELPPEHQQFFFTPQPLVNVDANRTRLSVVLESIAKQVGAEVVVADGVVRLNTNAKNEK